MACEHIEMPDGGVAIVCNRTRTRPKKCSVEGCVNEATKLCDFPRARGGTCDNPLCGCCAVHAGPDVDYCPHHEARPAQGMLAL